MRLHLSSQVHLREVLSDQRISDLFNKMISSEEIISLLTTPKNSYVSPITDNDSCDVNWAERCDCQIDAKIIVDFTDLCVRSTLTSQMIDLIEDKRTVIFIERESCAQLTTLLLDSRVKSWTTIVAEEIPTFDLMCSPNMKLVSAGDVFAAKRLRDVSRCETAAIVVKGWSQVENIDHLIGLASAALRDNVKAITCVSEKSASNESLHWTRDGRPALIAENGHFKYAGIDIVNLRTFNSEHFNWNARRTQLENKVLYVLKKTIRESASQFAKIDT